jgi:hypothetical protein
MAAGLIERYHAPDHIRQITPVASGGVPLSTRTSPTVEKTYRNTVTLSRTIFLH